MFLHKLLLLLSMSLVPLLICTVIKTELERLQLSGTKEILVPTAGSQETWLNTEEHGPFGGFSAISVIWKNSGKELCDISK